ncbi:MAG TPA: hypothetical protein VE944_24010 [Nostoc sp.]|nr:hypothetical protein [Nostoc sp.]
MKRPLPGFTTQNPPSPTRRGTDLNFSSRQGEVRRTHDNLEIAGKPVNIPFNMVILGE